MAKFIYNGEAVSMTVNGGGGGGSASDYTISSTDTKGEVVLNKDGVAYSNATIKLPTSLPANGGNAATVNGHSVAKDVPENANFENTTYSVATTSVDGLMSSGDKTKLNGIASGAEENVQSDWNVTDTNSDDYIKNKPSSLPANGGNSDTVDGSHAWQMQTLSSSGAVHGSGSWVATVQHNVDGDGRFKMVVGDRSVETKVDYATSAGSANSVAWSNVSNKPTIPTIPSNLISGTFSGGVLTLTSAT